MVENNNDGLKVVIAADGHIFFLDKSLTAQELSMYSDVWMPGWRAQIRRGRNLRLQNEMTTLLTTSG
jgi:hypothetical protein